MEKTKILIDRERLSSGYVESKQNFGQVLSHVKNLKPPVWKSAWFYGPIGIAIVAVVISIVSFDNDVAKLDGVDKSSIKTSTHCPPDAKTAYFASVTEKESVTEAKFVVNENDVSPPNKNTSAINENVDVMNPEVLTEIEDDSQTKFSSSSTEINSVYPHFDTFFNGDIPVDVLCSGVRLTVNKDVQITSFNLQYYDGKNDVSKIISGNKLSEDICELIKDYNMGSMIFLTNIKGIGNNGDQMSFPSANFTPVF